MISCEWPQNHPGAPPSLSRESGVVTWVHFVVPAAELTEVWSSQVLFQNVRGPHQLLQPPKQVRNSLPFQTSAVVISKVISPIRRR